MRSCGVNAAQVSRAVGAMITQSKMRLLAIPTKLAPRVRMSKNVNEAQQMIADAIHEALVDLSSKRLSEIEKIVEDAE